VVEWLTQETDSAGFQGLIPDPRVVAMPGNENDGYPAIRSGQLPLQFKTAHPAQLDIEHEASRVERISKRQEAFR